MGKRPTASGSAAPAKAAKTKAGQTARAEPVVDKCAPLLDVLGDATLRAALPHCLRTPAGSRHLFEERVLDCVQGALVEEEALRRTAVTAAEKAVEDFDRERQRWEGQLGEAQARAAGKAAEKDVRVAACKAAEQALQVARGGVASAKAAVEALGEESRAAVQEEALHREGLAELWAPLKTPDFEGKGWRERNKAINTLSSRLQEAGAPESLLAALQVALKEKPDKRGPFAEVTIAAGEELYHKKLEDLVARIEALGGEAQARRARAEEAELALQAAETACDGCVAESIAAQNTWVEETTVVADLKETLRRMAVSDAAVALRDALGSLHGFLEVAGTFATLRAAGAAEAPAGPSAVAGEEAGP